MRLARIISTALAAALAAGALTAAYGTGGGVKAEAATVAPVAPAAIKAPRINMSAWADNNHGVVKTVAEGKAVTLKVKASGGSLTYQWYVDRKGNDKYAKVSGKAAKRAYLRVTATAKTAGSFYKVVVKNAKGRAESGTFQVLVKRNTSATSVKRGYVAKLGRFLVARSWNYPDNYTADAVVTVQNVSASKANPASTLRFAYRAPNGKLYKNANGFPNFWDGGWTIKEGGKMKPGSYFNARITTFIPKSAKGGHWVVWTVSNPSRKVTLK